MAKCKNCKNLFNNYNGDREVYIGKVCIENLEPSDIEIDRECQKFECIRNSDNIRRMTDEELAEFIHKTIFDQGSNMFTCEEPPVNCHEECKECYMDWLQKEVE